ncbi:histidine kinase dimerization/phosphoacceptor domain -containing protein [Lunatibacter salilacus]|uniref:histidine kinase dimerization/phosphoacceptor domain -containing protein n=1 Tax=Lunatibacter salilacus TaxID=2483804 RepID=UPI00131DEBF8|nr:histidine kinase dimerization/phosphoacceptor domain -containing protein [Lunatibacter salilacus]
MDREEYSKAIEVLTSLKNNPEWVKNRGNARKTFNNLGYSFFLLQEYSESAQNYEIATQLARELQDTVKWITSQTSLAMAYRQLGLYAKSLNANQEALSLAERRNDWENVLNLLNTMGIMYQNLEQWENALERHREALELSRIHSDTLMQSYLYTNLAISQAGLGRQDSSLHYNLLSLDLKEQLRLDPTASASNLNNIGENYLVMDSLDLAENYLKRANKLYSEKGDKEGLIENYNNLARYTLRKFDTQKAAEYLDKAKVLLTGVPVKELYIDYLLLRTSLLEQKEKYSEALVTHKELASLQQEVFQEEQLDVQRLEASAALREKNLETQNLAQAAEISKAESERKAQLILILLAGLIIAGLVTFFFIRLNRHLSDKNKLIEIQKLELKHTSFNILMRLQALLRLTSDSLKDTATREKLQQVEAAIISAASLQQFTYGIENEEEVSLGDFLNELVERLKEAFTNPAHPPIVYTVEVETDSVLPVKTVMNCGLMVAEMITNSIKHATIGISNPNISVRLSRSDSHLVLQVGDNGMGYDRIQKNQGIGSNLIYRLASYIKAELTEETEGGTSYTIRLKC